jgi:hypothetical protein
MFGKRAVGLIGAGILLFTAAGCGDDGGGGGGGDVDAFCDRLEELDDEGALNDSEDTEAAVEAFDDLLDDAPGEIRDDLETMRDAFAELTDLDEDDPGSIDEAFSILFDEDVVEATQNFGEFAADECDIEGLTPGALDDLSDLSEGLEDLSDLSDFSDDFSSDFSSEFSDEFSDDFSVEPANASDRLREFLDAEYPDLADLVEGIGAVDLSEDEVQVTLTVGDEPADEDTGLEICEAVVDFAEQDGLSSIDIEVENDENGDDALLATGDLDDGCEAA